jgi:diguanylate cyclase (GGDEF)-like protein
VPVMYAVGRERYLAVLADPAIDVQTQLKKEREIFRLDHTEVGRILAQKLDLPEVFVDAVAFHHNQERLNEFMQNDVLAQAIHASALFPHVLDAWNPRDADDLCRTIDNLNGSEKTATAAFLREVQNNVDEFYRYFDENGRIENRLADLLIHTAREGADQTEDLVRTVHQLMQDAASMGLEMSQLIQSHTKLMDKASRDPLTGLLNREAFSFEAEPLVAQSSRYGIGFAVAFFDIDNFKQFNDTYGHQFGDRVLKAVASCFKDCFREKDPAARMGGDEFTLLIHECAEDEAQAMIEKFLRQIAETAVGRSDDQTKVTLSAGLLYIRPSNKPHSLQNLIEQADKLMYTAKQSGKNQLNTTVI